jgi:hypothetical protein
MVEAGHTDATMTMGVYAQLIDRDASNKVALDRLVRGQDCDAGGLDRQDGRRQS